MLFLGAPALFAWQDRLLVALIVGIIAAILSLLTHVSARFIASGTSPLKFSLWCAIAIITGVSSVKGMAIVLGQFGGVCFGIVITAILILLGVHGPRHRETKKMKLRVSLIVDGYNKGEYTAHEASDQIMECITARNVGAILSALPDKLLLQLKSCVHAAPTTVQEWKDVGDTRSTAGLHRLKDEPPILPDDKEQSQTDERKRLHRIRVEAIREHLLKYDTT